LQIRAVYTNADYLVLLAILAYRYVYN